MRTLLGGHFVGLALGVALMLGCFPSVAEAGMVGSRPAGQASAGSRQASLDKINRLLAEEAVAETLAEHGLSTEQIKSRLDRLNDEQLEELSQHLETIEKGQGSSSLLVLAGVIIVLAVVLIYMQIEAA